MSLSDLLNKRYSVRAFTSKSIEPTHLEKIFTIAQQSVSNCNVQPWQVYVVSGEQKDNLKKNLVSTIMSGAKPNPDFDWVPRYQGKHRDRQFGSANALYSSLDISREDKQARQHSMLRNWQFFDAPHVAFFTMEKYLGIMGAVDLGIYAQTLTLLLAEEGISSCMQGALGQFPDPIKELLKLDDDNGILFGLSFGYADEDAAVNTTRTTRAELSNAVSFIE